MGSLIQIPQDWIALVQQQFAMPIEGILERSSTSLATILVLAFREAVEKTIQLRTPDVILESDYRIAINAIPGQC